MKILMLSFLIFFCMSGCKQKDSLHEQVVAPTPTPYATPKSRQESSSKYKEQLAKWNNAQIRPEKIVSLDKAIFLFQTNEARYKKIQAQRSNGVPPPVIFALHGRESSWNYKCHLHNGDSLMFKTAHVPKGRIPGLDPPYSFEASASDALYGYEKLELRNWIELGEVLQNIESFNGLGYQKNHPDIASPYLWSATNIYERGKYIEDGKFDSFAVDKQLGCAAILKRMQERGIKLNLKNE